MKKIYNVTFPLLLLITIFYGLFLLLENSYNFLHEYQFVIAMKSDLVIEKRIALIDAMKDLVDLNAKSLDTNGIDKSDKIFSFFKFKQNKVLFSDFSNRINSLTEKKINVIFQNLWKIFNLPIDLIDGLTYKSKKKFIIDLFSKDKEIMKFKFNFTESINGVFKNLNMNDKDVEVKWHNILKQYEDYNHGMISQFLEKNSDSHFQHDDGLDFSDDERTSFERKKNLIYFWIDKKFNIEFFGNTSILNEKYNVLSSVITILWIGIFIIITILSIALFSALYLYIFVENNSKFRVIFLNFLEFYQFLPEILLIGLGYTFFIVFLKLNLHSILFIGLNLFLIIFPLIVNLVFRSLNLLTNNLKENLRMEESKVKFLINNILPVISPYIGYHILKIIAFVTNFGFLILVLASRTYSLNIPHGFSNSGSFFVSDFLISVIHKVQNIDLASPILLSLLIMNIFFYLIAFFIKRFIKFDLN
jgi:hypothetical protein